MVTKMKINDPAKAREYFEAKMAFTTGPVELERMIRQGENINIVDVRAAEDYAEGHIPGAVNLPKDKWDSLSGLRKDKINVLYCYSQVCHLAATAAVEFAGALVDWLSAPAPPSLAFAAPERSSELLPVAAGVRKRSSVACLVLYAGVSTFSCADKGTARRNEKTQGYFL